MVNAPRWWRTACSSCTAGWWAVSSSASACSSRTTPRVTRTASSTRPPTRGSGCCWRCSWGVRSSGRPGGRARAFSHRRGSPEGPRASVIGALVRVFRDLLDSLRNLSFRWLFGGMLSIYAVGGRQTRPLALYMLNYFWEVGAAGTIAGGGWRACRRDAGCAFLAPGGVREMEQAGRTHRRARWAGRSGRRCRSRCGLLGYFPENGAAVLLPLLVGMQVVQGVCVAQADVGFGSMVADVVDEQEFDSGKRQEGMFFASTYFAGKASSGIGAIVAGVVLDLISWPRGGDTSRRRRTFPPGRSSISAWCTARWSPASGSSRSGVSRATGSRGSGIAKSCGCWPAAGRGGPTRPLQLRPDRRLAEPRHVDHAAGLRGAEEQVRAEQLAHRFRRGGHVLLVLEQIRVIVDRLGIEPLIRGVQHGPRAVDGPPTGACARSSRPRPRGRLSPPRWGRSPSAPPPGSGWRRKPLEPGTTRVAPPSAVMPSQGMQKVMTQLCSGNGAGSQFWSACTPPVSSSLLYLMEPANWLPRKPLPTLTSASVEDLGIRGDPVDGGVTAQQVRGAALADAGDLVGEAVNGLAQLVHLLVGCHVLDHGCSHARGSGRATPSDPALRCVPGGDRPRRGAPAGPCSSPRSRSGVSDDPPPPPGNASRPGVTGWSSVVWTASLIVGPSCGSSGL